MSSEDRHVDEPRGPYIETADELERFLSCPGASLWRYAHHEWWIACPPDDGSWGRTGIGVTEPALSAWCRRHDLPLPPPDAECARVRHPTQAREGDIGYVRLDPGYAARLRGGDLVPGQDSPHYPRPPGTTLVAYCREMHVPVPLPECAHGPATTIAAQAHTCVYRVYGGFDTVEFHRGTRAHGDVSTYRLRIAAGRELERAGSPVAQWLDHAIGGRPVRAAPGFPADLRALLRVAREPELTVLARPLGARLRIAVAYSCLAPRAFADAAPEFVDRRYLLQAIFEGPQA